MSQIKLNHTLLPYVFLFVVILLIVLNPYTIFGKPGMLFASIFAIFALLRGMKKPFFENFMLPTFFLFFLATFGVASSIANGIPQINHPLTILSMMVMMLAAYGIFMFCKNNNISTDNFLLLILLSIFLNSVIILLELQFVSFRNYIEGFLDPISGSSINYAEGFRLRGIASSGGAGLSISIPAALTIAIHLLDKGKIRPLFFLTLLLTFLASVAVIGRTGIILSAIPLGLYFLLIAFRRNNLRSILKALFSVLLFLFLVAPFFYNYIVEFFTDMFGDDFVKYAFGFLLSGRTGIEEEGTVSLVLEFLKVLPLDLPQALTGYGFYGGSYFYPWTDGGFNRTFLSIGFILGFIFYFIVYYMYLLPFRCNKFLIGSFVLLLTFAEIKEPLLFSGVGSRMFILILVFYYCENKHFVLKKT